MKHPVTKLKVELLAKIVNDLTVFLERWLLLPSRDFTCSKSTIERLKTLELTVAVNSKDTRMISMTSFSCFYCYLSTDFTHS